MAPYETHGLSHKFIKALLFDISKKYKSTAHLSPIDVDLMTFSQVEVRREWENIDVLFLDNDEKFLLAIENKIDANESNNQLEKYRGTLDMKFPGYQKLFIYLTIDGDPPQNDDQWLPYTHADIHNVIISLLKDNVNTIGDDVRTLLLHYTQMIQRHFMDENEIAILSKKLYERHRKALDIIFEHRPDRSSEVRTFILNFLERNIHNLKPSLHLERSTKSLIRFSVLDWDKLDGQLTGTGQWAGIKRVLVFEILNLPSEVSIKLTLGPGDEKFREDTHAAVTKALNSRSRGLTGTWTQLYKKKLLSQRQLEYDLEKLEQLIQQEFENFFYKDLDPLLKKLAKALNLVSVD
jgi:hypothetical protein